MKKILPTLALLALVGFGCAPAAPSPAASTDTHYANVEFGFAFDHSADVEVRDREEKNRPDDYLGLNVDFFASVRDMVRDESPTTLAYLYAASGLTAEAFVAALEASDASGAVKVTSTEDVTVGGASMKKVTSTTQVGTDKIHYLWDHNGKTIIFSVFIEEVPQFDPILATIVSL